MKKFQTVFISLSLFFLFSVGVSANTVSVPEISDINPSLKDFSEPLASGFVDKDSSVLVYFDGKYFSDAEIVSSNSNNLFYFFISSLPSEGMHTLSFITRNQNGILSAPTKEFNFYIKNKLDKPQILKTNFTSEAYFFGESSNENFIDLYIDNELYSTSFIEKNSKNTFKFLVKEIEEGNHSAYFIARDAVGRISSPSKKLEFNISKAIIKTEPAVKTLVPVKKENKARPSISDQGVVEEVEEIIVEGIDNIDNSENKIESQKKEQEELNKILKEINKQDPNEIGSLTEDGQRQSDLKWNLIIFLAFLVAVIFWIIWVNKEMQEENSTDDSIEEREDIKKE